MYPTVPPRKHPNTTPPYIPGNPQPKIKQNMYANALSNIKDLSKVIIKEYVPLPTPWNIIEDIIPWGIASTNKLSTEIAVAIWGAKDALAWVYENNVAIWFEKTNIMTQ